MNIKKGVNRVALLLSVIAIFPGFIFAWLIYDDVKTKTVLVYDVTEANMKLFSNINKTFEEGPERDRFGGTTIKESPDENRKTLRRAGFNDSEIDEFFRKRLSNKYKPEEINAWLVYQKQKDPFYGDPRMEYVTPPKWKCAIAGVVGASISFLFVLFCLHGIFWTFIWVVEGFKSGK